MDNIDLTLRKFFASDSSPNLVWDDTRDYREKYHHTTRFGRNALNSETIFQFLGLNDYFIDTILHNRNFPIGEEHFYVDFTGIHPDGYFGGEGCDCCSRPLNPLIKSQGFNICENCDSNEREHYSGFKL